jgi:methyl-accepting chemotaxis protein
MAGRMTVAKKLGLGFGVVLALLATMAGVAMNRMGAMDARLNEVVVNGQETRFVNDMLDAINVRARTVRNAVLDTDPAAIQAELKKLDAELRRYQEARDALAKDVQARSDAERGLLKRISEAEAAAIPLIARVAELATGHKAEEAARVLMKELRPVQNGWIDALKELKDLEDKLSKQAAEDAERTLAVARTVLILSALLATVLGAAAAVLITRGIARQLGGEPDYAAEIARKVSEGDLTLRIAVRAGDTTSLLFAMKCMVEKLQQIVGEVRSGANALSSASSQVSTTSQGLSSSAQAVAAGSQTLSQGTAEQAASVEETTSSLEEMSASITQNSENSRQTEQMATAGAKNAEESGKAVGETVEAMK